MAEGFTEHKTSSNVFFLFCPVTFDGYYRNKNQKTKQGFFFNWNTYTTGQAFCFLKCLASIGGKKYTG
jgi:hypothetical protein